MLEFVEFNADQNRLLVDAANQYDQWLMAMRDNNRFAGMWMTYREKNGREYLTSGKSNGASQKSHGVRSIETDRQLEAFNNDKAKSKSGLDAIQERLGQRAPLLKALTLGRILAPFARVVREYDVHGLLASHLLVGGTHAITAYEVLAGRFFDSSLTATEDLDFIWHGGATGGELIVKNGSPALLKHLKAVDSSYTVNTERTFQARNSKGLVIDFISDDGGAQVAPKEYLKPIALPGQEWLIGSKPISVVVIDTSGLPVRLVVPDPRIYALHKAWVSERADRTALKKGKDMSQAVAVASLVKRFLPQHPFDDEFLSSLGVELANIYTKHLAPVIQGLSGDEPPRM